jgi:hypothetical protein
MDLRFSTHFDRAKRKETYRRLARLVRRAEDVEGRLLDLDDVQYRLRIFDQHYDGVRPIPVAQIVGTAGRADDFDEEFLPRRPEMRDRWRTVEQMFPQGEFPPIVVYQVDRAYFVVDGHHRVAIAKRMGVEMIDAEVTVLRTRHPLPPDIDVRKLIFLEQRRILMDDSGLDRSRPEVTIDFSRPDGYVQLLELIKVHGYHLMQERGEVIPPPDISGDWYDRVYFPTIAAIQREGLAGEFAGATEGDLFLWIWERRRALNPTRRGMTLQDAAREVPRKRDGARRAQRNPAS